MQARIEEKPALVFAGSSYYGTLQGEGWSETNSIGYTWSRFSQFIDKNKDIYEQTSSDKTLDFEIHIWQEDHWKQTKEQQVFTGYLINSELIDMLPLYLDIKVIPAATYFITTITGEGIKNHGELVEKELKNQDLRRKVFRDGTKCELQVYSENFKLDDMSDSAIQLWIPLE